MNNTAIGREIEISGVELKLIGSHFGNQFCGHRADTLFGGRSHRSLDNRIRHPRYAATQVVQQFAGSVIESLVEIAAREAETMPQVAP